jgi:hypothetical protein
MQKTQKSKSKALQQQRDQHREELQALKENSIIKIQCLVRIFLARKHVKKVNLSRVVERKK